METSIPPRLPGLELLRPIGRGAFGEVWLARTVTGQFRAVKLVPLGTGEAGRQDLGERVFRGVQAYLDHLPPGSAAALAVLHVDRAPDGRFLYYVMELADDVAGGRDFAPEHYQALTLSEFRRRSPGQFVPAEETIRLGGKLAAGLAALHAAGLVHRDIKPNNVVFIGGEPRLADIDLVRPAEASLSVGGAQGYSPLEGPGRPTADVFSLARTLYVTVTGLPVGEFPRLPEDWDRRPDAPALRRLNAVLLRASDRDPAKRHPNAATLAEDLQRLERGEDVERDRTQRSRNRRIAAAAAALLAFMATALLFTVPILREQTRRASFESYRQALRSISSNLDRNRASAHSLGIAEASTQSGSAFDLSLFQHQVSDISATPITRSRNITISSASSPIQQLLLNKDGSLLASLSGNTLTLAETTNGTALRTIVGISSVWGFTDNPPMVIGQAMAGDGRLTLSAWQVFGDHVHEFPRQGIWSYAGMLHDNHTIAVFSHADGAARIACWTPGDDNRVHREVDLELGITLRSILGASVSSSLDSISVASSDSDESYNVSGATISLYRRRRPDISDSHFEFVLRRRMRITGSTFEPSTLGNPDHLFGTFPCGALYRWDEERNVFVEYDPARKRIAIADATQIADVTVSSSSCLAALSDDAQRLAALDFSGHIRVFGVPNWVTHAVIAPTGGSEHSEITALAWSGNSCRLAAGGVDGTVTVWDAPRRVSSVNNRKRIDGHVGWDVTITVCEGQFGNEVVCVSAGRGQMLFLDGETLTTFKRMAPVNLPADLRLSAITSDVDAVLASCGESDLYWALSPLGTILQVGIPFSDYCIPRFGHSWTAFSKGTGDVHGAGSPDSQRFVLHDNALLAVWGVDGEGILKLSESSHPFGSRLGDVVFSSDSRFAVVLADDGSALLTDLDSGATRLLRQLNEKTVTACFRPDSTECYFGTSGGRLLRLDTAKDDPPELLDANFGLPAHMIATPDGERLLTAGPGEQLGIRRLPDGAPIVQLTHHGLALEPGRHNLKRLLYLPKQQRVLSLSEDGWLTQW